jgi:peroxiredoxin family protein
MLAVILESGEPTRLYTAFSLLTSTAAEGEEARCLVTFGALPALMEQGDMAFEQLRWTAGELSALSLNVCAAALASTGVDSAEAERRIGPVMSTPRFLRETAGARLVVV